MPQRACTSGLSPTRAIAGIVPTAKKAATASEFADMNSPNWPAVKSSLLTSSSGAVAMADDDMLFRNLTKLGVSVPT